MDVLSGSYSRMEGGMAGLFFVLEGQKGGGYAAAKALTSDGKAPLIIGDPSADDGVDIERICTRPFAADLNGDGFLDIVSGNFAGYFAVFNGLEGGRFEPTATWLMGADGERLRVEMHSDPTLADMDGDGDLDLVSGDDGGSVMLFPNVGSKTAPSFGKGITLLKGMDSHYDPNAKLVLGDDHIKRPQSSTRIAVADVNGDGKSDILVGDNLTLHFPADGVDTADIPKRLAEWQKAMDELEASQPEIDWGDGEDEEFELSEEDEAAMEAHWEQMEKLYEQRSEFIRDESTGSVWLMLQK